MEENTKYVYVRRTPVWASFVFAILMIITAVMFIVSSIPYLGLPHWSYITQGALYVVAAVFMILESISVFVARKNGDIFTMLKKTYSVASRYCAVVAINYIFSITILAQFYSNESNYGTLIALVVVFFILYVAASCVFEVCGRRAQRDDDVRTLGIIGSVLILIACIGVLVYNVVLLDGGALAIALSSVELVVPLLIGFISLKTVRVRIKVKVPTPANSDPAPLADSNPDQK